MENKKIVIVEDERPLRDAMITTLKKAGFSVITATNGKAAIKTIRLEQPDLVLLDLFLPKRDGYEVLRDMKSDANTSDIKVLIFSVLEDPKIVKECMDLGADDYIFKSGYSLEKIIEKIKKVLKIK